MKLIYRQATIFDIDILVSSRIEVLIAANQLSDDVDMTQVREETLRYYKRALETEEHCAYLVFCGEDWVGAGGVSFFQVMPTYHNPSGRKAYIMNMYTKPTYRRQGIAFTVLDKLVAQARSKGVDCISLEATAMGAPLYRKYGFVPMEHELELPSP